MQPFPPDGRTVAFSAEYEGPLDVYTMPVEGGLAATPNLGRRCAVAGLDFGWPSSGAHAALLDPPDPKLVAIDDKGQREIVPLAQSAEGAYSNDGKTLFFTRYNRQPSQTKRYQGGTAENIWRYEAGSEALLLTGDWKGTSHNPMFWNGRVYFLSDRDGVMNVFSMNRDGQDLQQLTHHRGWDVQSAAISEGRIVYQCGADLWLLDSSPPPPPPPPTPMIPITLVSDFDQLRDHWVKKPLEYLTGAHIAPDGSAAVFTARGQVFTFPATPGRVVTVAGKPGIRYREARYMPDGKNIIALSTETGETEFWKYPANGVGAPEQWTNDDKVLRWEGIPSPDARWLAYRDKDQKLWLYDTKSRQPKLIGQSMVDDFNDLTWSPDSQWLAYVESATNTFSQIKVLSTKTGDIHTITSDHYNSVNPAWSSDGKWLYFLSDRMLTTTALASPWGTRQPGSHFDRSMKIYELALTSGLRSPFAPADELHPDTAKADGDKTKDTKKRRPPRKTRRRRATPRRMAKTTASRTRRQPRKRRRRW